jgi:hypothetical protein
MSGRIICPLLVLPLTQEVVNSAIAIQRKNLALPLPQLPDNLRVLFVAQVNDRHGVCAGPCHVGPGADDQEEGDETHERHVGCKDLLLLLLFSVPVTIALVPPPLPVLPCCVHTGISWLVPPTAVCFAVPGMSVGVVVPAKAIHIVHASLLWVAEEFMGSHDEAIALELRQVGDPIVRRRMFAIRVVEHGELDEALLIVGLAPWDTQNLVRCRIL